MSSKIELPLSLFPGLDVVAIHHHMTGSRPIIMFLHYWGDGPAEKLATEFKAALNELGKHSEMLKRIEHEQR